VSREVLATVLTMSGYTVHAAEGGEAALRMLAQGECVPEAILMDAQMPGLNGALLIAELRARSRAMVFAISATQPAPELIQGADAFLLKPFGPAELRQLLAEHLPPPPRPQAHTLSIDEPIISAEILAQLRALMPEAAVREIYAAVVADLSRRLNAVELAIAKGDAAEIRRLGHAIKGGCGMAGARQAASLGAMLELSSAETTGNHLDNSMRLLRDLRAAARNLERMLEAKLPA
jgi:CheY-like chemotaxis protein/HPt (histidine-containing phosphotransfer) domain-containing protein